MSVMKVNVSEQWLKEINSQGIISCTFLFNVSSYAFSLLLSSFWTIAPPPPPIFCDVPFWKMVDVSPANVGEAFTSHAKRVTTSKICLSVIDRGWHNFTSVVKSVFPLKIWACTRKCSCVFKIPLPQQKQIYNFQYSNVW